MREIPSSACPQLASTRWDAILAGVILGLGWVLGGCEETSEDHVIHQTRDAGSDISDSHSDVPHHDTTSPAPDTSRPDGDGTTSSTVWASPDGWTRVDASEDPFEDRPDSLACSSSGYAVEPVQGREAYGLFSERCEYLTARQPARASVEAGDTISIQLWHFDLTAPEGGEAHVALAQGDDVLWETRISIPSESNLVTTSIEVPRAISKGAPLYYHVHNHGQNEYYLFPITLEP